MGGEGEGVGLCVSQQQACVCLGAKAGGQPLGLVFGDSCLLLCKSGYLTLGLLGIFPSISFLPRGELGLQMHSTVTIFLCAVSGSELTSSYLYGMPFTRWALFPVLWFTCLFVGWCCGWKPEHCTCSINILPLSFKPSYALANWYHSKGLGQRISFLSTGWWHTLSF